MNKSFTTILTISLLFGLSSAMIAQSLTLSSPDKRYEVEINVSDDLSWSVSLDKIKVIEKALISMDMGNGRVLGRKVKLLKKKADYLEETFKVQVPNKDAVIDSKFNQMTLFFDDKYEVIFRAYNDGVAYRFVDKNEKSKEVYNEVMTLSFPKNTRSYFPKEESMYSHNEREYLVKELGDIKAGEFCSLPVMMDMRKAKVLFTEASLHNYPGMFLSKDAGDSFSAVFPKYVLEAVANEKSGPDRNQIITKEADYIAKVDGAREYPWRVFMISDDDRTFVESNLVTQLSQPSKIPDADWIKPGKVAWDWYNANNIYGVDFEAGINMPTYKYFIDFASKNNIEYVILDEGWTKSTTEILEDNEELDVPELIQYAKSKKVDIILWVLWKPLDENPDEILKLYASWGAVGVKVDFMQRSDQYMVQSYEKIAEIAAKYKLLVDYHGAFKPAGIERVWPNLINYEGVKGNENNKWSDAVSPEHNVTIPFIRMAAGPIDFTPGSMINANKENYFISFTRPMSLGTRAHQVAMYVVFEAPIQMMCESPTIYYKEQETVDFITQIPTIWDETRVLEAAVSDYIIVARRLGEDWYLGAMTDWDARDFEIDLSFLGAGSYQMQSLSDGVNAARNAIDYKLETKTVSKDTKLPLQLSKGGGFSAIFKKIN
ncbi:MAG: alpha-glucosidase [Saprospiraceae bacterium]|jgi:alpha-glucosidase